MRNSADSSPLLASASVENYEACDSTSEQMAAQTSANQDASVRWTSIRICYLTFFISSLGFSICLTAVWPYLQQVDSEADESFLGWVIAAFSIGQLLASPVLGLLFNVLKQAKAPLLMSLACELAGSMLYAYIESFPSNRRYALLGARFVLGAGAGHGAVIRSFVAGATTVEERTQVMATVSMCQSLGFIVGPAVQAAFTTLGYPGPLHSPLLWLNVYTSAGWVTVALGMFNIAIIVLFFKDFFFEATVDNSAKASSINLTRVEDKAVRKAPLKPDAPAAITCIIAFSVLFVNFSTLETIMTPLSQVMFAWTKEQALLYNGVALAVCGGISLVAFVSVRCLVKLVSEIDLIVIGLALIFAAFALVMPWSGDPPPLQWQLLQNATGAGGAVGQAAAASGAGCPDTLDWCRTQPAVRLPLAVAALVVHTLGFPIVVVMISTVISKILGPMRQGIWMGLMASGGGLGRCVGPVLAGQLFTLLGPQSLFLTSLSLVAASLCVVVAMSNRMVPYEVYRIRRQQRTACSRFDFRLQDLHITHNLQQQQQ